MTRPLDALWQDVRDAVRLLGRDRSFAVAAVLSLALGIGANTAIFQLLDAVRLRVLPVQRPGELVEVRIPPGTGRTGSFTGRRPMLTYPQFDQLRQHQQVFAGLFAWSGGQMNTAAGGDVRHVSALWASGEMFDVLGVQPVIGRVFTPADDRPGCGSPGAVLNYAYWQREFAGAAAALQQTVRLDGVRFEIIGVTPPEFFGVDVGWRFDVVVPLCADDLLRRGEGRAASRSAWWLSAIARLGPGATADQANAHLATLAPGIMEATVPPDYTGEGATGYKALKLQAYPTPTGVSGLRTSFGQPLAILLVIAGLVLAIACANLANLLLARAATREREIAVRLAVGATRGRIVRQLLVESVLLAVAGALLGIVVARGLSGVLVAQLSDGIRSLFLDLSWDYRVFGFTTAIAAVACLIFGLVPAIRATALAPAESLKTGGRGASRGSVRFGLRRALVVTQVALSLVLLVGAFLFTRTLYNVITIETGIDQDVVVVNLSDRSLADRDRGLARRRALVEQLRGMASVSAVAQADLVPLDGNFWNEFVFVEGGAGPAAKVLANFTRVGEGYFTALGIPLVAGRDFDDRDGPQSSPVAIVNETFVRRHLAGRDPMGATFRLEAPPGQPSPLYQVIGVARDTKYGRVKDEFEPLVHLPSSQETQFGGSARFVIKPRATQAALMAETTRRIAGVNPAILIEYRWLTQTIRGSLMAERLMAALSAAFGALAVLLAAVGLYGVMSYTVARRSGEIGIRLAMGAARGAVLRMVLGDAARLVAVGVVIGAVLGFGAARLARGLLFGLQPADPLAFAASIGVLAAIALIASYLPARRASRVDPLKVLRED
jgi:predicted permease